MSPCSRRISQTIKAAAFLYSAAHLQASPSTAYVSVCCNAPSTVTVLSTSTLAHTRSIVTGSGGDSIVLSPDGTKMFVTVDHKPRLQVIATGTGALLATVLIPIGVSGEPPLQLAISPTGSYVYVLAPQDVPNTLMLAIDTTTYAVAQSLTLPFQETLGPLLISPDGTQLYFENGLVNETIEVIDAATLTPLPPIPVNESPTGLAITPSGLILMPDTSDELLIIDPRSSKIVNGFPLPGSFGTLPGPVISSPDGTTAYLSFPGPSILAVNIATGATLFDVPVNSQPNQFAVSSNGVMLYSTNLASNGVSSVSAFNIPSQSPSTEVIQLGPLSGLALSPNDGALYVLNADESAIASVDAVTQKVTRVTLGGVGINALAIPPTGQSVWASSYAFAAAGNTLILNPATGQLKFTIGAAGSLAFSPSGTLLYVASPSALVVLDAQSMKRIAAVPAANLSNIGQAIPSPDGTRLYVSVTFVSGSAPAPPANEYLPPGVVLVLDASNYQPVATVNIPNGLGSIALTPDGSILACNSNLGRV